MKFGEPGKRLLLYKMRAPSSTSLLSKAYNFLKGKTSQNDENFYAKTRSPFPSEIYHTLSEPIDQKRGPSISRKNRQILGEISNRPWSVAMDREQKQQSLSKGIFSPRAMVKNYWTTSREDKKLNNELQQQPKNGRSQDQEDDDIEEEGIFKIQVCGLLFHLKVSNSPWKLGFLQLGNSVRYRGPYTDIPSICLAIFLKKKDAASFEKAISIRDYTQVKQDFEWD